MLLFADWFADVLQNSKYTELTDDSREQPVVVLSVVADEDELFQFLFFALRLSDNRTIKLHLMAKL